MLMHNGWFTARRRPHVVLETDGATAIMPTGIKTGTCEERPEDVIVLATASSLGRYYVLDDRARHPDSQPGRLVCEPVPTLEATGMRMASQ
jgi:hypothetical protein